MKKSLLLASLLLPLSAGLLPANTIYNDSFSSGSSLSPVPVAASKPDINTDNNSWANLSTTADSFSMNGSDAFTASSSPYLPGEYLPFSSSLLPTTPTGVLTISADVTSDEDGSDATVWIALGFASGTAPIYSSGDYWMLMRANGEVDGFTTATNGPSSPLVAATDATSSSANLSEQLNFSTDVATYLVNNVAVGTTAFNASAFLSSATAAEFQSYQSASTVDNFVVSYSPQVPEPSTYALLGLGAAALSLIAGVRRFVRQ